MTENATQTLIIITGSPCVGKTTVADALFVTLENSAFCDGDWMWCVNPFSLSDPRLRNGDRNMSFVLSTYLNSGFNYVLFSYVGAINEQIRQTILNGITAKNFKTIGVTLTCSEPTLIERHSKRGDTTEVSFQWLHEPAYPGDYVINTDGKTVVQIAEEIRKLLA